MTVTSVLITPVPDGDKYDHAINWRINCLSPDWVHDSVERGCAVDMEPYRVLKKRGSSTPTHDTSTARGNYFFIYIFFKLN